MDALLLIILVLAGLTTWSVYIIGKKVSKMEKKVDEIQSKLADAHDTKYHGKAHSGTHVN
jgi:hypothetical protein